MWGAHLIRTLNQLQRQGLDSVNDEVLSLRGEIRGLGANFQSISADEMVSDCQWAAVLLLCRTPPFGLSDPVGMQRRI